MNKDKNVPFHNIAPFLEAVITASNRSRNVVLILSTASILAFVGFWNSRPQNWISSRVTFASNNVEYLKGRKLLKENEAKLEQLNKNCLDLKKNEATPTPTPVQTRNRRRTAVQSNQNANLSNTANTNTPVSPCQQLHTLNNEITAETKKFNESRFSNSENFYKTLEKNYALFDSPDNLLLATEIAKAEEDLRIMGRIRRENTTIVRIPFFGTSFDVNDLSIVSGITFTIILIWLRLSLWTELNSTYQVFERVKKEDLIDCYEYLSMHLVFTIPKALDLELKKFGEKQWKWVVLLIILLPVSIQSLVLINDLVTVDLGSVINLKNTVIVLVLGFATFVMTALLTASCLSLSSTLNRLWREQGAKINEMKKTANKQPNNKNQPIDEIGTLS